MLNGVKHLERSVVSTINDQVSIYCNTCGKVTEHRHSGQFLFLPETLVLVFKRFYQDNRIKKKHSKVQLPLELEIMENQPFRYKLRACALHHGMHSHSGHYTAVIFDEGKVIEIDDDKATDLTNDWIYRVQSTVYLAFYSKNYASSMHSSKLYNALVLKMTEMKRKREVQVRARQKNITEEVNQV